MIFNKKQEAFKRGYDQGVFDTLMEIIYVDPFLNRELTEAEENFKKRLEDLIGEIE